MKKIISILIVAFMLVSLVACNGTNGNGGDTSAPEVESSESDPVLNKFDVWVASMAGKTVNNGTLVVTVVSDMFESDAPYAMSIKLTENLISIDDAPTDDANVVAGMQNFFGNTVLAIAGCRDFTADGEGFKCASDIIYEVSVQGVDAKITLSGTVITFDENGELATVSAKMTQDFVQGSQPVKMVMDTVFAFSNFGTTEITK
jgi:predicted small secreted protein